MTDKTPATTKLVHPDAPENVIEVDGERAELLKLNGWGEHKPAKSDDK